MLLFRISDRRSRNRERGQAVIMVTMGLVTLVGLLGLVVDVGYGYYLKQHAQTVADATATAAAAAANSSGASCSTSVLCQTGYTCSPSPTADTNFGDGCIYAQANGFTGTSQTVTLSSGTGTTSGVSSTYWVQATAAQPGLLTFGGILGVATPSVSASATAAVIGNNTGGCIYVLNPNIGQAMTVSGGSSFIKSNCGIYVNSSASNALTVSGGATVTASQVNVVGSTSTSGGSTITPQANTGVSPASDPLANLPTPSVGNCDHTNFSINGGTSTIDPGVYCGGLKISGGTVTLNPGNYIINGGGLTVSGGNTTVTGNGVFFYNTASGYSYAPVTLSGGDNTTLTAPTSGTYQGILIFDDRTITSSAKNTISGGTGANFSGTVYVPSQQLTFSGGSTSGPLTMVIVCDTYTISGGSYLAKDATGQQTGIPPAKVYLIQ